MDALKNVFINWLCDAYKLEKKEEVYWSSKLEGCSNVTPIMPLVKDNLLGVEEHLVTLSKILVCYGAKEIPNKAIIELEPFEINERKYHISSDVIEKIILSYTIKQRKIAKYRILLRTLLSTQRSRGTGNFSSYFTRREYAGRGNMLLSRSIVV